MGCQFVQNADVAGDTVKTASPLLGTWIYWKHSLSPPTTNQAVLGEKEHLRKTSGFSA